ncbi:hypothetical protein AB6735_04950 [Mucilaginibacter sp. RCC_168]|uniref:hypothetical protein n=1 Tax=Mucilaginibacter sp. RCC_168 TaxID=3239221 RepID=UPI00352319FE
MLIALHHTKLSMYEKANISPSFIIWYYRFSIAYWVVIVVRRMLTLIPVLINGYHLSSYGYCLLPV